MPSIPSKARAVVSTVPSLPLKVIDEALPSPLPASEILIRVHAAAINPVDVQLHNTTLLTWFASERGFGRDFAGEVVAVGTAVKSWQVGDECLGLMMRMTGKGTFSEYIAVNPTSDPVVKKPSFLSYVDAASVPLVSLTAFTCLDWLPKTTENGGGQRRVVVRGASGGTGIWVVQLAKQLYNCHVTAICSGRNEEFVSGLGADDVVDYTSDFIVPALLERKPGGRQKYDLFVDCLGGTDIFPYMHDLLHPNAAYVTIVGDKTGRHVMGGPVTYLSHPAQIVRSLKGMIWGPRYACVILDQKTEWLQQTVSLLERGDVKTVVQEVVKGVFDSEAERKRVMDLMVEGRVRGKIVVDIAG